MGGALYPHFESIDISYFIVGYSTEEEVHTGDDGLGQPSCIIASGITTNILGIVDNPVYIR